MTLFKLLLAGGGSDEVPDDDDEVRGEAGVEMAVVLLFLSKILSSFPLPTRKEEDDATALELVPSPVMDFLRVDDGCERSLVMKVVVAVVGG